MPGKPSSSSEEASPKLLSGGNPQIPKGTSRHPEVRYLDIYEDELDEDQFTDWVRQASRLPGEKL